MYLSTATTKNICFCNLTFPMYFFFHRMKYPCIIFVVYLAWCTAQFMDEMQVYESECLGEDMFPCVSGGCILREQYCDEIVDCDDGSDENFCCKYLPTYLILHVQLKKFQGLLVSQLIIQSIIKCQIKNSIFITIYAYINKVHKNISFGRLPLRYSDASIATSSDSLNNYIAK